MSRGFWIFVLLVGAALLRIGLTYRWVAQTIDETPNIACGMQWIDQGRYDLGPFHPPLARIAMAVGPYLYGSRSQGLKDRWQEGNAVLHSHGKYPVALTLARLGILPFFVLAAACVWLWSARLLGERGALVAVFIFTNLPIVLAHAGIATTDMAVAAGVVFSLYRLTRWIEKPDARNSVLLGVGLATALLSKFSAFLVVPLCSLAILMLYAVAWRRLPKIPIRSAAIVAAAAFVLMWGAYRFSIGRMQEPVDSGLAGQSSFWAGVSRIPLPAAQIPDGLMLVRVLNHDGHPAFLHGEVRQTGWWYFFPVALALKTPLAVLILAVLGGAVSLKSKGAVAFAPALCCLAILGACLFSHLNTGLRYLLCLFPMLSIAAAQGTMYLWNQRRLRPVAAALVLWLTVSSLVAHPDYIAYFNELAGAHPENILVDSDLDWGQDMKRLVWKLHDLKVDHVYLACMWSGDDSKLGLPGWDGLDPYHPVKGWVAVSYTNLKLRGLMLAQAAGRRDGAYDWLLQHQPAARIGKSILLYHITD
jgi:4-amino-4-deoxy-L-arabinose transferase-like glycosyltransferase